MLDGETNQIRFKDINYHYHKQMLLAARWVLRSLENAAIQSSLVNMLLDNDERGYCLESCQYKQTGI